jgi:hypothetical protein
VRLQGLSVKDSDREQSRLILSIVLFVSGVACGHSAVARRNLSFKGVVTARLEPPGLKQTLITLDGRTRVSLDHRSSENHDLMQMLQVGDHVEKRSGEMSVVVNGSRRPWPWWAAWPAYIGCILALLGTGGVLAHVYGRYARKRSNTRGVRR